MTSYYLSIHVTVERSCFVSFEIHGFNNSFMAAIGILATQFSHSYTFADLFMENSQGPSAQIFTRVPSLSGKTRRWEKVASIDSKIR